MSTDTIYTHSSIVDKLQTFVLQLQWNCSLDNSFISSWNSLLVRYSSTAFSLDNLYSLCGTINRRFFLAILHGSVGI